MSNINDIGYDKYISDLSESTKKVSNEDYGSYADYLNSHNSSSADSNDVSEDDASFSSGDDSDGDAGDDSGSSFMSETDEGGGSDLSSEGEVAGDKRVAKGSEDAITSDDRAGTEGLETQTDGSETNKLLSSGGSGPSEIYKGSALENMGGAARGATGALGGALGGAFGGALGMFRSLFGRGKNKANSVAGDLGVPVQAVVSMIALITGVSAYSIFALFGGGMNTPVVSDRTYDCISEMYEWHANSVKVNAAVNTDGTAKIIYEMLAAPDAKFNFKDAAIAGMLSNGTAESSLRPACFEMDYKAGTADDGGDMTLARTHHRDWSTYCERMFEIYPETNPDLKIDKSGYKYEEVVGTYEEKISDGKDGGTIVSSTKLDDGPFYPGVGLWQWTGRRAYHLQCFADTLESPHDADLDGHNDAMYNLNTQIAWLVTEDLWDSTYTCYNGKSYETLTKWAQDQKFKYFTKWYYDCSCCGGRHSWMGTTSAINTTTGVNYTTGKAEPCNIMCPHCTGDEAHPIHVSPYAVTTSTYETGSTKMKTVSDDGEIGTETAEGIARWSEYPEYNTQLALYNKGVKEAAEAWKKAYTDKYYHTDREYWTWHYTCTNSPNDTWVCCTGSECDVKGDLKCTTEENHQHSDANGCYSTFPIIGTIRTCFKTENHTHGDSCYNWSHQCSSHCKFTTHRHDAHTSHGQYFSECKWDWGTADGEDVAKSGYSWEDKRDEFSKEKKDYNQELTDRTTYVNQVRIMMDFDSQSKSGANDAKGCAVDFATTWEGCPDSLLPEHVATAAHYYSLIVEKNRPEEPTSKYITPDDDDDDDDKEVVDDDGGDDWVGKKDNIKSILEMLDRDRTDALLYYMRIEASSIRCGGGRFDNSSLAAAAISWAWPNNHQDYYDVTSDMLDPGGAFKFKRCTSLYIAVKDAVAPGDTSYYASCDRGVATAILASGSDDDWDKVMGACKQQLDHARNCPNWEEIGPMNSTADLDLLEPGDLLLSEGHVMVFVGTCEAAFEKWPDLSSEINEETCKYAVVHSSRSSNDANSRGPRYDTDCKWILTDSKQWYGFRCTNTNTDASEKKAIVDGMDFTIYHDGSKPASVVTGPPHN